ncbi:MAG: hypothetical protein ACHQJ7_03100 [Vicinamibacteria bacterium]|jgi:hypothetical protein
MNGELSLPGVDAAVLARLGVEGRMTAREAALYVRYLRAIALLCECAPYVDEPDYTEMIDTLLDDAAGHYPFDVLRDGMRRGLAPRASSDD